MMPSLKTLCSTAFSSLIILFALLSSATAQPSAWDARFALPNINETNAMVETPDAYYIGGTFTNLGTTTANHVVRLDKATGELSPLGSSVQNGTNGPVQALALVGTNLYVAGIFARVSSSSQANLNARCIAKWDILTQKWSSLGSPNQNGINSIVYALLVINSDVIVAGGFSTASSGTQNSISANKIAKWNIVSETWSSFGNSIQNGISGGGQVRALATDGTDLYVGGAFNAVSSITQNSVFANNIAKWDTISEIWQPLGSPNQNGTSNTVQAITIDGSDVYAGGLFTIVNSSSQFGLSANYIAKWNPFSSTWSPLGGAHPYNGTNSVVRALAIDGDAIFVGGDFSKVSSISQLNYTVNRIAKWSRSSGTWSRLGSGSQNGIIGGFTRYVNTLLVSGSELLVGGWFDSAASSPQASFQAHGLVTWSTVLQLWQSTAHGIFGGINGHVASILDTGPFLYVGGQFTMAGAVAARNIACWDKASGIWSSLGSSAQNGTDGIVSCLAMIEGILYVGGSFYSVSSNTQNSIVARNIAMWNPSSATWSPLGSPSQNGTGGEVLALVADGSNLVVGGNFSSVSSLSQNGISANNLAKWSASNGTWTSFGSSANNGTNSIVSSLAISGTNLFVGGYFSETSSQTQISIQSNCITKWDAVTETWHPLGSLSQNGTQGPVFTLAVIGDDLFVGGGFASVSSSSQDALPVNNIARWHTSTETWHLLGSSVQNGTNGHVLCSAIWGSDLLLGGDFTAVSSSHQNTAPVNFVAIWKTQESGWAPVGGSTQNGASSTSYALVVTDDSLYVGGGFFFVSSSSQNSIPSKGFGVFYLSPQDTDNDGLLDVWELSHWPAITTQGPLNDSDGDGYCELLELGLGLNPNALNTGGLPVVTIENGFLTTIIMKQPGVLYHVESGDTLLPALPNSFSSSSTTIIINDSTTLKARDNFQTTSALSRFLRVQVTADP